MNVTVQSVTRGIVAIAITTLILFLVWFFSEVVIYILVSAVLAIMFRPLVSLLSRIKLSKWNFPRSLAALITLFIIWGVFALIFGLLVPLIFSKINQFETLNIASVLHSIDEPLLNIQHYIQNQFSLPASDFSIKDSLEGSVNEFIDYQAINNLFSSIINIAISAFISFFSISFITFFFLKDDGLFYNMVTALFPDRYQDNVVRALDSISLLLSRYFIGIICESFIITIVLSLALSLIGMETSNAWFIGTVMGVINVIPYAGPVMGGIFSLVITIINPIAGTTTEHSVLVVALILLSVKAFDDFVLQPTLYSERVKAHPLEIFIVILLAGYVAGIVGMLLAIPSYTVLRVFAKEFFSQISLVRKLTDKI